MSYHSVQVFLAVSRLIAARECAATHARVDCRTIDLEGSVGYQISAEGDAEGSLAQVLSAALGGEADKTQRDPVLSLADATKLIKSAYS